MKRRMNDDPEEAAAACSSVDEARAEREREQLERFEKLLTAAREWKDQGNKHFQEKNTKEAMRCYHKAILHARGVLQAVPDVMQTITRDLSRNAKASGDDEGPSEGRPEIPRHQLHLPAKELLAFCHLNLAACLLLKENCTCNDFERIVKYCEEALEADLPRDKQSKAHYRKGVAHYHLKNLKDAKESLNKARELEKEIGLVDPEIIKLLNQIALDDKVYDQRQREEFRGMFDRNRREKENPLAAPPQQIMMNGHAPGMEDFGANNENGAAEAAMDSN